ncbi:hypothetical protein F0L68_09370 [Solihabitans fulvus]|uniref:Uncharacterized protein n=1 Tax=Solihabitans fulvus TaxID=1892852 RepID=A0A5B2XLC6_9PSEU|nr:hypothetical protein [Solihabitans fulvus]KAA2263691.1 hypothetical protein F0L68_09370 [Solihabitans fulvus]
MVETHGLARMIVHDVAVSALVGAAVSWLTVTVWTWAMNCPGSHKGDSSPSAPDNVSHQVPHDVPGCVTPYDAMFFWAPVALLIILVSMVVVTFVALTLLRAHAQEWLVIALPVAVILGTVALYVAEDMAYAPLPGERPTGLAWTYVAVTTVSCAIAALLVTPAHYYRSRGRAERAR